MPRFLIIPIDRRYPRMELRNTDESGVLHTIGHLECREADVVCEGRYRFTAQLGRNGVWRFFER